MNRHHADHDRYRIRVAGHLSAGWAEALGGWEVRHAPGGETLLCGRNADQAALHALLRRIRDAGMTLVSVSLVRPGSPETTPADRSSAPPADPS